MKTEKIEKTVVEPKAKKKFSFKKLLFRLLLLIIFVGIVYGVWQNPEVIDKAREAMKPSAQEFSNTVEQPVKIIEKEIIKEESKADLSGVENRLAALESNKADNAAVLGLMTKFNDLENKTNRILNFNNDVALVLTATMLVKDSADKGITFEYETQILEQLTQNAPEYKEAVGTIKKLSVQPILTSFELIKSFGQLKEQALNVQKERQTWWERIKTKFREVFKIRKTNEKGVEEKSLADILSEAEQYVQKQDFMNALKVMGMQPFAEKAIFASWESDVMNKMSFIRAINQITATSLAQMRASQL